MNGLCLTETGMCLVDHDQPQALNIGAMLPPPLGYHGVFCNPYELSTTLDGQFYPGTLLDNGLLDYGQGLLHEVNAMTSCSTFQEGWPFSTPDAFVPFLPQQQQQPGPVPAKHEFEEFLLQETILLEPPYPEAPFIAVTDSAQASVDDRRFSSASPAETPGQAIYSPITGARMNLSEDAALLPCVPVPRAKKPSKRATSVACAFCRKRKIACGGPPKGSTDKTCGQCARRNQECEYPRKSYRGYRCSETD
ncbi:hypothetical protein B0H21DRAFT_283555 [Amylocystis lapponica]|nr:hypothetical protein B0H21DRAFT_283555 [Amylocystis lapponica]